MTTNSVIVDPDEPVGLIDHAIPVLVKGIQILIRRLHGNRLCVGVRGIDHTVAVVVTGRSAAHECGLELGEDLADEIGIEAGDKVRVSSARGSLKAVAVVTRRFKGLTVDGQTIHQIGILWHWGYSGRVKGDSGNILTPHVGDANTTIPEYKTFLCNVEKLTEREAANV